MQKITIQLETITPLFLGGAETRGKVPESEPPPKPELRTPSLRGALRYWYRALVGGLENQDNLLEQMHKRETLLFGGAADEKRNIGQSVVSLQIVHPTIKDDQILTYQREHNFPGKNYLYWSMEKTKQEGVEVTARKYIRSGFPVELVIRRQFFQDEKLYDGFLASVWLLARLGGLGSRSRRGAGNFRVLSISGDIPPLAAKLQFSVQADTPDELAKELHKGIKSIFEHFGTKEFTNAPGATTQFDVLNPGLCQIYVLDRTFETADDALNAIGVIFQKFRNRRKPDTTIVWNSIETRSDLVQSVQRAAFGLPIQFFYKHSGDKATLQSENYERRSSPLSFKIERLSNDKYAVVITWFKSALLPNNEHLKLVHKKKGYSGDAPNDHLVSTFLTGSDKEKLTLKDNGINVLPAWGVTL